jgi:hypothetical protein
VRRRALLRTGGSALVAGAAGCVVPGTGSDAPSVAVASRDDPPDLPVRPSVEVATGATDDHPPRLRTALANGSDAAVKAGEGGTVLFDSTVSEGGETIERTVALWGVPTLDDGACLPAGTHRFEAGIAVWTGSGSSDDPEGEGTWGFAVEVA